MFPIQRLPVEIMCLFNMFCTHLIKIMIKIQCTFNVLQSFHSNLPNYFYWDHRVNIHDTVQLQVQYNHSSPDNLLAGHISPFKKFVAFFTLYKVPYTHRAFPIWTKFYWTGPRLM